MGTQNTKPKLRTSACLACLALASPVLFAACHGDGPAPGRTMTPEEAARRYPELAVARSVTLSKQEPPTGCESIGTVTGRGWSADDAYENIKKEAARRHANYVVLDGVASGLFGRAFRCPEAPPQPAVGQTAPAAACQPDCSPGYTCVSGSCVSACNPPCETGQRCGADRTCHLVR